MYFLSVWDEITITVIGAFRSLMLSLCDTIYRLIIFCFNVFEKIGNARLLDNATVNMLYEKVGLILGIYMIFRLTFVAVQYVLDPDKMTDKSKGAGKLLMKAMVVIVLLGTTPFIFDTAYKIQYSIAKENIIGKIFLDSDDDYDNFGGQLSWYLFSTFYKETEEEIPDSSKCPELYSGLIEKDFINNSSLKYTYNCINERGTYEDVENGTSETYVIEFDGLLASIAGIAMLWIIVMYTISVGFRLIQLAFLELIAPLPIMMYLEPKDDGPFQKWVKLCISCYLDYFIRTAIIYFMCYLVNGIMDMDTSYFFTTLGDTTDNEYRYIIVIIIFALLMFAKKIPDLIKEIMPSSGTSFSDFGFSLKNRTDSMLGGKQIYGAASAIGRAGTVGLVGAAATGAVGFLGGRGVGRLTGLLGGAGRGLIGSSKSGSMLKNISGSMKKQSDINGKKIDWTNSGSTWGGRMRQRFDNALGIEGQAEAYDNEIRTIDHEIEQAQSAISTRRRQSKAYQEVSSTKSKMLDRAVDKLENGVFKPGDSRLVLQEKLLEAKSKLQYLQQNGGTEAEIRNAQMNFNQVSKETSEAYVDMVVDGSFTGDAAMTGMATHIRNLVADDRDGAFVGLNGNIASFADLDSFEGAVSGRNSQVGEEIAQVERGIQIAEDRKKTITSSDGYRSANANRNAVGGHKGGNR